MVRRLLQHLWTWITRPLYNEDDPLEEYWARKRYENEYWER